MGNLLIRMVPAYQKRVRQQDLYQKIYSYKKQLINDFYCCDYFVCEGKILSVFKNGKKKADYYYQNGILMRNIEPFIKMDNAEINLHFLFIDGKKEYFFDEKNETDFGNQNCQIMKVQVNHKGKEILHFTQSLRNSLYMGDDNEQSSK